MSTDDTDQPDDDTPYSSETTEAAPSPAELVSALKVRPWSPDPRPTTTAHDAELATDPASLASSARGARPRFR